MGFGDVTLMAMIGAFLGWQAAFLIFFLAPFTALLIAATQRILTGERHIAFGPYLCLAAVIVMVGWDAVWTRWAEPHVLARLVYPDPVGLLPGTDGRHAVAVAPRARRVSRKDQGGRKGMGRPLVAGGCKAVD